MKNAYVVLRRADPPHVCNLPPVKDFPDGSVIKCLECSARWISCSTVGIVLMSPYRRWMRRRWPWPRRG